MVKRVAKVGTKTLLSRDDRSYLRSFGRASRDHVAKVTLSREAALQELVDAGIYDRHHKLKKYYRTLA